MINYKKIYSNLICFLFFSVIFFFNNIKIKEKEKKDFKIIRLSWNIKNKIINKCKKNKTEVKNNHMKKRNCKNLKEKIYIINLLINDKKNVYKKIQTNKNGNSLIISDILIKNKQKKIKISLNLKNKKNKNKIIRKIITIKNNNILLLSYNKSNKKLLLK